MIKTLAKYLGAGLATAAAVVVSGGIALAYPPPAEVGPGGPRAAVRENREAARDARIDRRAYRNPGDMGLRFGRMADRGLAIANLATGGAFYNAGLRPDDYIVSINGHRILAPGDFDRYLYAAGPDQPAQVVVWRNGADVTLTLQPNVIYTDNYDYDNFLNYFGVVFDPQYPNELVVERVLPNSLAFRAGLRAGDVISDWNGQAIRSPKEFARVIENEKPGHVAFDYRRGGQTMHGNFAYDRRENRPEDRTAERERPNTTGPANPNPPNGRELNPGVTSPTGREPTPGVTPLRNPREPTPGVTPPRNPREPTPGVTPPTGREPPSANPPAGREPPGTNPPTGASRRGRIRRPGASRRIRIHRQPTRLGRIRLPRIPPRGIPVPKIRVRANHVAPPRAANPARPRLTNCES